MRRAGCALGGRQAAGLRGVGGGKILDALFNARGRVDRRPGWRANHGCSSVQRMTTERHPGARLSNLEAKGSSGRLGVKSSTTESQKEPSPVWSTRVRSTEGSFLAWRGRHHMAIAHPPWLLPR